MTTTTDLSSSLSGALDTLLGSLRAAAPQITCSLHGEGSEWYYEINKRTMIRVPNGTEILEVSKYPPDERGRVVVQTINNEIIRVDPERILKLSFH
tara:strand:- start:815 stop:1102 length:288 start_codon:yes stop_codon:yes gene_type:complete